MTRRIALIIAATLLVAGLAGCGDDDEEATTEDTEEEAPAEEEGAAEGELTITADEYSFDVPDEVEGGVVTVNVENKGKLVHEAIILGIDGDQEEVLTFLDNFEEGPPIPAAMHGAGGIFELAAGDSASTTQTLPEGDYIVVCTLTDADSQEEEEEDAAEEGETSGEAEQPEPELEPHHRLGMVQEFTVTGGEADADDLPDDSVIVGTEYTFDTTGARAGEQITFVNEGPKELHLLSLSVFPEGTTEAQANQALQAFAGGGEGPPPPDTPEPEDVGDTSIFDPGGGGTLDAELESDRVYLAICFIQDRAGGPPHLAKGMAKVFTVE